MEKRRLGLLFELLLDALREKGCEDLMVNGLNTHSLIFHEITNDFVDLLFDCLIFVLLPKVGKSKGIKKVFVNLGALAIDRKLNAECFISFHLSSFFEVPFGVFVINVSYESSCAFAAMLSNLCCYIM